MTEMNVSGFSDDNHSTIVAKRYDISWSDSAIFITCDVIWCMVLALGIPGNILSAIVWLRRRVVIKNSSAVYLAALAIDDLVFLLCRVIHYYFNCSDGWFCNICWFLVAFAGTLEPLLVLGFSVERLIAIYRPLQVCCIRFTLRVQ